ncbi:MAG: small multi-drug export (modular protein) [Candidatus Magasanikbacteria bacterium]|nr:small multi-drug export (modular protein) [Candidatus Magasanikbacteria bacterium]
MHAIINFFLQFPPELATFFLSMVPVAEMRLSLPMALLVFHLPVWEAIILSIVGTIIPTTLILLFGEKFHRWVEARAGLFFGKAWARHLIKIQKSFTKYEKYGLVGLFVFVAVSLPGTGSYTAAIVAFLLGIPIKKSWPFILGGVIISAIVITLITLGADKIF